MPRGCASQGHGTVRVHPPRPTRSTIFQSGQTCAAGTGTWGGEEHSPNTPTTGLRERGNDTSRSTGRSGRQKAATRRNMRRDERVTVQGPVKEQQPDGMSHGGRGGGHILHRYVTPAPHADPKARVRTRAQLVFACGPFGAKCSRPFCSKVFSNDVKNDVFDAQLNDVGGGGGGLGTRGTPACSC